MKNLHRLAAALSSSSQSRASNIWGLLAHNLTVAAREAYFETDMELLRATTKGVNEILHRLTAELRGRAVDQRATFEDSDLIKIVEELSSHPYVSRMVDVAAKLTLTTVSGLEQ